MLSLHVQICPPWNKLSFYWRISIKQLCLHHYLIKDNKATHNFGYFLESYSDLLVLCSVLGAKLLLNLSGANLNNCNNGLQKWTGKWVCNRDYISDFMLAFLWTIWAQEHSLCFQAFLIWYSLKHGVPMSSCPLEVVFLVSCSAGLKCLTMFCQKLSAPNIVK